MKLYLIASTAFRDAAFDFLKYRAVNWRQSENSSDAERTIEFCGRVCYMSFGTKQSPRDNSEYIRNLISQAHESVLEHATFSVLVDEVSRSLSQQLTRHRAGFSFSQLSQQYFFDESPKQIPPSEIEGDADALRIWRESVASSNQAYERMTNQLTDSEFAAALPPRERLRAIRSAARSVLPNSTGTSLVITANVRAWRNLLEIRGNTVGDFEMTEFCVELLKLLKLEAAAAFQDFTTSFSDGRELVEKIDLQ